MAAASVAARKLPDAGAATKDSSVLSHSATACPLFRFLFFFVPSTSSVAGAAAFGVTPGGSLAFDAPPSGRELGRGRPVALVLAAARSTCGRLLPSVAPRSDSASAVIADIEARARVAALSARYVHVPPRDQIR